MKEIGYVRVSSRDQDTERQRKAMKDAGVSLILEDKASGKDFNRPQYKVAVNGLDPGDCLVVYSLDRLGRNYTEIREQWEFITREKKANIRVLDMPLLDTRKHKDATLDNRFVADLVLQVLSYVAQKERESIRARQRMGIDVMEQRPDENGIMRKYSRKTGRPTGRPAVQFPAGWDEKYTAWKAGKITATQAMQDLGLKRNSFYKLAKMAEK